MVELVPCPFPKLVSRMFDELRRKRSIFDLKEAKFFLGDAACDLGVTFHGKRASSPLGPAAGPHSQLAQNILTRHLPHEMTLAQFTVLNHFARLGGHRSPVELARW